MRNLGSVYILEMALASLFYLVGIYWGSIFTDGYDSNNPLNTEESFCAIGDEKFGLRIQDSYDVLSMKC